MTLNKKLLTHENFQKNHHLDGVNCSHPSISVFHSSDAIYIKWDSITMFSSMDLGIAVEKAEKGAGRIRVETFPEQKVAIAQQGMFIHIPL